MKIECACPYRQKTEHTAMGAEGMQMLHTHGLQPMSLFPQILGRFCLLYLSLPTRYPEFLKLHWLFGKKKKEIDQKAGIK